MIALIAIEIARVITGIYKKRHLDHIFVLALFGLFNFILIYFLITRWENRSILS